MNYDQPLNKRKSNGNAFYTLYISHSLRIQKIFAVWATGFSTIEVFDVAIGQKRASCSFDDGELIERK